MVEETLLQVSAGRAIKPSCFYVSKLKELDFQVNPNQFSHKNLTSKSPRKVRTSYNYGHPVDTIINIGYILKIPIL